jgi:hypothetical protein
MDLPVGEFDANDTQRLLEQVRQSFLAFLGGFALADEEDSRSQFTQNSDVDPLTQPTKPYVDQVQITSPLQQCSVYSQG